MFKTGSKLVGQGKLALAIEHYNKIARKYPKNYEVHMILGGLYKKVEEEEMAKVEYYRAMLIGNKKKNYDANFAMADVYVAGKEYEMGLDVIKPLIKLDEKKLFPKIGDFYYNWGISYLSTDKLEAIRKFKSAFGYYTRGNDHKSNKALAMIQKVYTEISDELVNENHPEEAIRILNLSLNFQDNAISHYKLGRIYENIDEDKAIDEYEKAFNINSRCASARRYADLLIKKAAQLAEHGDKDKAEYYYNKARNLNPKASVPFDPDKQLILTYVTTKYSLDSETNELVPGVSFKVKNTSDDLISHLRGKVIFYKDEKYLSEDYINIASDKKPLNGHSSSGQFNIFSIETIPVAIQNPNIRIEIYLSRTNPETWKLYRSAYLIKEAQEIFY